MDAEPTYTTIAELVALDYDEEFCDRATAKQSLENWSRNNASAKRLIESLGMSAAIKQYLSDYEACHAAEYGSAD